MDVQTIVLGALCALLLANQNVGWSASLAQITTQVPGCEGASGWITIRTQELDQNSPFVANNKAIGLTQELAMVCKEDVFTWFRNLNAHNRIDFMCELVHYLLPLELRLLGSCVEDLAKKDYICLRESENQANSISKYEPLTDITNIVTRSKLNVYLALLHSCNTACAHHLYTILSGIEPRLPSLLPLDHRAICEIILLLTIARNNPAFTFDEKRTLSDSLERIKLMLEDQIPKDALCSHKHEEPEAQGSSSPNIRDASETTNVYIQNLDVVGSQKHPDDPREQFRIQVTWSSGEVNEVLRTHMHLYDFHTLLIKLFPKDSGAHKQERHIPFLPIVKTHGLRESNEQLLTDIRKYIKQLSTLQDHILRCEHVTSFFQDKVKEAPSYPSQPPPVPPQNVSPHSPPSVAPQLQPLSVSPVVLPEINPEMIQRRELERHAQTWPSRSQPPSEMMEPHSELEQLSRVHAQSQSVQRLYQACPVSPSLAHQVSDGPITSPGQKQHPQPFRSNTLRENAANKTMSLQQLPPITVATLTGSVSNPDLVKTVSSNTGRVRTVTIYNSHISSSKKLTGHEMYTPEIDQISHVPPRLATATNNTDTPTTNHRDQISHVPPRLATATNNTDTPTTNHRHTYTIASNVPSSPHSSPLPSPLSSPHVSPHVSPTSSMFSSPSSSPCSSGSSWQDSIQGWLKKMRLHKYKDTLSRYTFDQLLSLTEGELEEIGLTPGARGKLLREIEKEKEMQSGLRGTANGIIPELVIVNSTISSHREATPPSPATPWHTPPTQSYLPPPPAAVPASTVPSSSSSSSSSPKQQLFPQASSPSSSVESSSSEYSSPPQSPCPDLKTPASKGKGVGSVTVTTTTTTMAVTKTRSRSSSSSSKGRQSGRSTVSSISCSISSSSKDQQADRNSRADSGCVSIDGSEISSTHSHNAVYPQHAEVSIPPSRGQHPPPSEITHRQELHIQMAPPVRPHRSSLSSSQSHSELEINDSHSTSDLDLHSMTSNSESDIHRMHAHSENDLQSLHQQDIPTLVPGYGHNGPLLQAAPERSHQIQPQQPHRYPTAHVEADILIPQLHPHPEVLKPLLYPMRDEHDLQPHVIPEGQGQGHDLQPHAGEMEAHTMSGVQHLQQQPLPQQSEAQPQPLLESSLFMPIQDAPKLDGSKPPPHQQQAMEAPPAVLPMPLGMRGAPAGYSLEHAMMLQNTFVLPQQHIPMAAQRPPAQFRPLPVQLNSGGPYPQKQELMQMPVMYDGSGQMVKSLSLPGGLQGMSMSPAVAAGAGIELVSATTTVLTMTMAHNSSDTISTYKTTNFLPPPSPVASPPCSRPASMASIPDNMAAAGSRVYPSTVPTPTSVTYSAPIMSLAHPPLPPQSPQAAPVGMNKPAPNLPPQQQQPPQPQQQSGNTYHSVLGSHQGMPPVLPPGSNPGSYLVPAARTVSSNNGCSQCGCSGSCSGAGTSSGSSSSSSGNNNTAHRPPHFNYAFVAPHVGSPLFPGFAAAGFMPPNSNGNGLVSHSVQFPPVTTMNLPNGIAPEVLYNNHPYFGLLHMANHPNHNFIGGPRLPFPQPQSAFPQSSSVSGGGGGHVAPPGGGKQKPFMCYNCGRSGHRALECKESTFQEMTSSFRLRYQPKSDSE